MVLPVILKAMIQGLSNKMMEPVEANKKAKMKHIKPKHNGKDKKATADKKQ